MPTIPRTLGLFDSTMINVGTMIGLGVPVFFYWQYARGG